MNVFWCFCGLERATLPFWELITKSQAPSAGAALSYTEEVRSSRPRLRLPTVTRKFFYSFRPIPRLGSRDSSRRSRWALGLLDHPHPFRGKPSPDPWSKSGFSSNLDFPHWPARGCPSRRRGGHPPFLLALLFRSPRLLPNAPSLSAARERSDSAARFVIGGGWARPGSLPACSREPGSASAPSSSSSSQ